MVDNGDLLPEGLCHPHTQSPCPCGRPLPTCTSTGDAQTQFCPVSVGSLGPWVSQGLFEPSERLWWTSGLILNVNSPLLPSCWGVSFAPGRGVSPHSRSSAYHLAGFSLTVIVGCLHTTIQRSAAAVLDLGRGVSIHSCSSEVQPALLTLDARYLLSAACCSSSVQPLLAAPVT